MAAEVSVSPLSADAMPAAWGPAMARPTATAAAPNPVLIFDIVT
ncbi:MAG: hypothetical protein U0R66_01735 [Mycobacterium sp.]